jgi:hypothetical protein
MVVIGIAGAAWAVENGEVAVPPAPVEPAPVAAPAAGEAAVKATEPVKETPIAVSEKPVPAEQDWADKIKRPVSWFSWGFDQRWRHEYLNNVFTLDHTAPFRERSYQRYRSRLWGTLSPIKELDLNVRVAWESRYWWEPRDIPARDGFDESNLVFDSLNFKIKQPGGLPMTFTGGRQDIILGDGWLVLDGTPLDGSRTIFFDAARLTWDFKDAKTTADVIYIQQYSDANRYLAPSSVVDRTIEQDERGAIFWVTNKSLQDTEINGYFIYKHNDAVLANGDDGDLYTPGARVVRKFGEHWLAKAEGALQFGNNRLRDVWAGGANTSLTYLFNDKWNNQATMGYEFLSGDDPGTATNEQFNPLWGRWPQFSELMAYHYATETRPGETTNLHRLWWGWQADPTKKLQVQARYHLLFSDDNTLERVRPAAFGSGSFRGQLVTLLARYKFNKFLSGHLLGEYFQPGHFYSDNRDDGAVFARAELVFAF